MTVRRETGARIPGDRLCRLRQCLSHFQDGDKREEEGRQSSSIREKSEGRARRPKTRRSSRSAIAAEGFMNYAG